MKTEDLAAKWKGEADILFEEAKGLSMKVENLKTEARAKISCAEALLRNEGNKQ